MTNIRSVIGGLAVSGIGSLGVSQDSSFIFVMPALIFAWYYFVGWLLDGWIRMRSKWATPAPD